MAETPIYALRTPDPEEVPNVPSDMQDLAEDVETQLARMDNSAADLADRVAALESGTGGVGWMPIGSGTASGASFSIDLTAAGKYPSPPLWDEVRVSMRMDLSTDSYVNCRINGDSDLVYRSGSFVMDSTVPAASDAENWHFPTGDQGAWVIARLATISTNVIDLRIFHTGASASLMAFQSQFSRQSDSSTTHRHGIAHGSLTTGKTATSLTFLPSSPNTFTNVYWWAEGLRLVAP